MVQGIQRVYLIVLFTIMYSVVYAQLDYDERTVRTVYNHLVRSIGNQSADKPRIKIADSKKFVAAYYANSNTIKFEREALDICRKFGKDSINAIAYILTHELGHAYLDHSFLKEVSHSGYASNETIQELRKAKIGLDTMIVFETQADEYACFYTSIAGYPFTSRAGDLLDSLYNEYGLSSKMKKYPSLEDRKKLIIQARENIKELIPLYEFSNYQYALSNYEIALDGYAHVLKRFPSREIRNNMALCFANLALELLPNDSIPIIIPFELDFTSRLYDENSRGLDIETQELFNYYLTEARDLLRASIQADENYVLGYYNLSLVEHFLENKLDRDYYLEKAFSISENSLDSSSYYSIKGVISFLDGGDDELENFQTAISLGNKTAEFNTSILNGNAGKTKVASEIVTISSNDNLNMSSVNFYIGASPISRFESYEGEYKLFEKVTSKSSVIGATAKRNQRGAFYKVKVVPSEFCNTESEDLVTFQEYYGTPTRAIRFESSAYLVYDNGQVMIEFENEKLKNVIWFINP